VRHDRCHLAKDPSVKNKLHPQLYLPAIAFH
jgi:hypothetical protein